jgi:hypothetical protein
MRSDILTAIGKELEQSSGAIPLRITRQQRLVDIWTVFVDTESTHGLDETMEDSVAWWPGSPKGAADVLSVLPEEQQINLRFATAAPPGPGNTIFLHPPRYLEALRSVWSDQAWADRCLAWLDGILASNDYTRSNVPPTGIFSPTLRVKQAQAFDLLGFKAGFLWGPPGTGKTYTLGAMLAQYLSHFATSRVLLLSTTNSATDQALVSVDKALEKLEKHAPSAKAIRRSCIRVGTHFVASNYTGREHLLPRVDESQIQQLVALEAQRPEKANVQVYARWVQQQELLRKAIRQQSSELLAKARLAAMTTTRAAFTFEEVYKRFPYDLVVCDEASQIGLAHALALAPLGQRALFAGDPEQLAPIVQSDHALAQRWLGKSMFSQVNNSAESTCFLNEQSRMAERICKVVSNVFYGGKLVVADGCRDDPTWTRERTLASLPRLGADSVFLDTVEAEGTWSQKYHGPIRYQTAERICDLVDSLLNSISEQDIIVLTPFRAQRTLARSFLERAGHRRVSVSTVHRAQGREQHTVIFDPVDGNSKFLLNAEARRLFNVAISRAKARLIVLVSPGDRLNPLIERICTVMEKGHKTVSSRSILEFASRPEFPKNALGLTVMLNGLVGEVVDVLACGEKFKFRVYATGELKTFVTSFIVRKAKQPS